MFVAVRMFFNDQRRIVLSFLVAAVDRYAIACVIACLYQRLTAMCLLVAAVSRFEYFICSRLARRGQRSLTYQES